MQQFVFFRNELWQSIQSVLAKVEHYESELAET
jgi:hypothetical protein